MNEHFLIFGLPRSMTAWVSCFLTCGDVFCQHEVSPLDPEKIPDFIRQPFPVSGICDSSAAKEWRRIYHHFPKARYAVILRRPEECVGSLLSATGISPEVAWNIIEGIEEHLGYVMQIIKPEQFTTEELQTPEGATRLWNYIAPSVPLPPAHLEKMLSLKVVQKPEPSVKFLELISKCSVSELASTIS